ncbi:DUF1566 domain-containing protein [Thiohalobacter sp. IOR34]|uniref:Lcl domain-containing protein n=1 Tax=Thiohalobacter sp. IOR34 TaxID=3057176 RepID=UPI0025B20457|nr:DUF1566 domain-containing protein [Thiohalobacter sp. IOR34]WJW76283.1 DUF1566 domain-containing protein [Thiohalobacter sp. IOR34]
MAIPRSRGLLLAALAGLAFSSTANAVLLGRLPLTPGGTDYQAYYDTTLDITWLATANLAKTNTFGLPYNTDLGDHPADSYASSYPEIIYSSGGMTWGGALHWIDAMNADGGTGYLGYNDWRLPMMMDTGSIGCDNAYTGTDCGFNVQTGSADTAVYSELASLWYDTLGNTAMYDTQGTYLGCPGATYCLSNTGPFSDIVTSFYWFGLESAVYSSRAWSFGTYSGQQTDYYTKNNNSGLYVWAVRSGDVAPVPLPAAVWLFGSGLLGLLAAGRRDKVVRR